MEIFGKYIFGSDAEQWLKLCKEQKKEWVFKYTNQTDETLIDEFIKNPKITKECKCLDCGKNGNISKTISEEVATDAEQINDGIVSERNSIKRQRKIKTAKD
jgi:hypothetical protein